MTHPPPLTLVDLFAGAGGLSEGFKQSGRFHTVTAVELDTRAAMTYRANHSVDDLFIGDVSAWLRQGHLVPADVVVGGPPCQGFSNLGARRPRDPRNALWRRYVDALVGVGPQFFVLENVADFLRSGQFRDLVRETYRGGRLRNYRIEFAVLNAAEFGAAQLRRRAVVIGSLRDLPAPGTPVGTLVGVPGQWATVRDSIGTLSAEVDGIDLPQVEAPDGWVPGPFRSDQLHLGRRPTFRSLERYATIPPGGNRHDIPDHLLPPCWRGNRSGSGDVMGRLHWDRPSVTIRTEFWKPEKGRYLHPAADRAITHHEAARLQGFPDTYQWFGSKADIGRQIGNAVPTGLAEGIAAHVLRAAGCSDSAAGHAATGYNMVA